MHKKSDREASFVLNKAPDNESWIDNVKKKRVMKLLKIQFMDNQLPVTEVTKKP